MDIVWAWIFISIGIFFVVVGLGLIGRILTYFWRSPELSWLLILVYGFPGAFVFILGLINVVRFLPVLA